MGRVTSKGNEANSKMKQPSDMPTPRLVVVVIVVVVVKLIVVTVVL